MNLSEAWITTLWVTIVTILATTFANVVFVPALKKFLIGPVARIHDLFYRKLAPHYPLSIGLRSYKRHMARSDLSRIDNPVGPGLTVPLEKSYAPLRLISSGSQESNLDFFEHAAASPRFIVLGGPGTGKTTLMKSLVMNVIQGTTGQKELQERIPIFIVLRELASKQQTVEQAIVTAFDDYHFPGAERFVAATLAQGQMIVILDGLDEVGARRDFVSSEIQAFCRKDEQRKTGNRVLVTCREHSYGNRDLGDVLPHIVRVEPFTNRHMRTFLAGWPAHKGKAAIGLYGSIQQDPVILDICKNPLLLTILTGLYLEDKQFQIPTSRGKFYKAALDELLKYRPGRRHITQSFEYHDKVNILSKVCLARLQGPDGADDSEAFTRQHIREQAEAVLQKTEADISGLIHELVKTNGIIKPGKEDTYTCAHRTIQEYLAAREAERAYTMEQILELSGQDHLIEMVYFYCGLIRNVPQLNDIATAFLDQGKVIEAGRCVLNMQEVPDSEGIAQISASLLARIQESLQGNRIGEEGLTVPLEILSSLAQRGHPHFASAQEAFNRAIDLLAGSGDATESGGGSGASALASVLSASANTTLAMKLIPGLLRHKSPKWRRMAVSVLRDMDTDESLDELVKLLHPDNDPITRAEAAKALADSLKGRGEELRARIDLLPERTDDKADRQVWPLEEFFPARLALPMAEALGDRETKNQAINYAARAIQTGDSRDPAARSFLIQWKNLLRDRAINAGIRFFGKALAVTGVLLFALILLLFLGAQIYGWANSVTAVAISLSPFRIQMVDDGAYEILEKEAEKIIARIEDAWPPNAAGVSRILPWNWEVEPAIPEDAMAIFEAIKGYTKASFFPEKIFEGKLKNIAPLAEIMEKDDYDSFVKALREYRDGFSSVSDTNLFVSLRIYIIPPLLLLFLCLYLLPLLIDDGDDDEEIRIAIAMVVATAIVMVVGMEMDGKMLFLMGMGYALPFLIGVFLSRTKFPRNPLANALEDMPAQ
uniref:HEAT repeat-containing protein n=1 Tax=Candidatus Kentrum sp. MB TaxID=2138164 RepID=A0A450XPT9_9GAMM|nr:MAG: HEAT repeat-containing protein [Candidatus Kentron sp. MB]